MATTQITTRQIADAAVTDAKLASAFLKANGSVPLTGDQSAGGFKVTGLASPSATGDAATKGYVDAVVASLYALFDVKPSARAATTGNVNLSNPGTAGFDGVTLTAGGRLLVRAQTAPAENGVYVFASSSTALTRAVDMDEWAEVPGALVVVEQGTTLADTVWLCTTDAGGTLNTTAITWWQLPFAAGLIESNFVTLETPTGSINGSNAVFTLANTPTAGSVTVFLNGLAQQPGAGNDYTISGGTVTFAAAPLTGEKVLVSYRK